MNKKCYKTTSWITLILFFFTFINNVNIKEVKADTTDDSINVEADAVLVGNLMSVNDLGKDWDPTNYAGKLKEFKNGIYEGTFKIKANDKYEYKIAMNGTWDESYGKDGGQDNIILGVKEDKDVTFRFDYKNKKIYDSINNPEQFKNKAILTGNISACLGGKDWDPSDDNFALDYIGGGMYEKTFDVKSAGSFEYKVAYNGAWDNGEITSNQSVTIKEGTKQITIYSDYLGNIVGDSVNNPELLKTVSLIGTVRNLGDDNWSAENKNFDMYKIDTSKVMYTLKLSKGDYDYKGIVNYSWDGGGIPSTGNIALSLASDRTVVFIADISNGTMIDSVNNLSDVRKALGFETKVVEASGPVINENGTITFNYKNEDASSVYLSSNINGWSKNANPLTKGENGVWSTTLRVGDDAKTIEYKYIVDGKEVKDPLNEKVDGDKSLFDFPKYEGRIVTIPGSISLAIEGTTGAWNPADKALKLDYVGNGNYKKTFKNAKAGRYEYKVAMNYKWDPENYGAKGALKGANISIVIPNDMDLTVYYNDDSHNVVTNLDYKIEDITLMNGSEEVSKLTDEKLNGIYTAKVQLNKGVYDKLSLLVKGDENKTVKIDKLTLDEDKLVTFSYDPITGICFNDLSTEKIDSSGVFYDSRIQDYKTPYGASAVENPISFNVKVKQDMAKEVKMVVGTPKGTEVLSMNKSGSYDDGNEKWTVSYTPENIGTYSYYFVVSNGSDVKAYGDDDGYFGEGTIGNLGEVKNYEFNVCTKDFKTPDWLKNAVIYQIYPDRFFNGDSSNDYVQKYARGTTPYEFSSSWYALPKDPELALKEGYEYPDNANKGDMTAWSNDLYGGDLKGIEDKVKYLKALGVTVLYLNPIEQSISSHRYDATDYNKVDPQLGNMDDFVNLAKAAHENGMHIILDGVYNHVCDDSIYFDRYAKYVTEGKPLGAYQYWSKVYDEMNNNGLSQEDAEAKVTKDYADKGITDLHYKDWFIINNKKIADDGDSYHYEYEGWSGFDSMPVIQALGGSEYNVKSWAEELIDGKDSTTRYWLKQGSDGWRLDCGSEVSDETWRAFRKAVKEEGDDAIVGEIWTDASCYLLGDMYDSVMNYRYRGAVLNYVRGVEDDNSTKTSAKDSMKELEKMREQYPKEALQVMMNLVDSHDTQRILSALDGYGKSERGFAKDASDLAKKKMKLIPFLQMTYVGAPTIYYGDEIGMVGCDDPDNRRGFTWGKGDKDLVEWYAKLAAIRSSYEALRTGEVNPCDVQNEFADDVMAYSRISADDKILVASNRQENDIEVTLSTPGIEDGTKLTNILNTSETYTVTDGKITVKISALNGVILVDNVKDINIDSSALSDAYSEEAIVKDRQVPETDAAIEERINNAKDGDTIVISSMNEGVSKNILSKIIDSGKNLKIVIQRGDIKITIKDLAKLKEVMDSQALNNLVINVSGDIDNDGAIKDLNSIKNLNITTNLKDGNLGSEIEVELPVDGKYNGQPLYLYSINNDGKLELVDTSEAKDSKVTFTIKHFSDYVVLNEKVAEGTPNDDVEDPSVVQKVNNTNVQGRDVKADSNKVVKTSSKKTGDENNTIEIAILMVSMIAAIGIIVMVKKPRKKAR